MKHSTSTTLSTRPTAFAPGSARQNRLDSALNNAQVYTEALSSAEARNRDTDFAKETSELTKMQIMQQAGVAALAQAKNINQSVISLLS